MEIKDKRITPYMAVPPGEVLRAELQERGLTQKAFAAQIGVAPATVCSIVNGRHAITPSIASKIESQLGISAHLWQNLQSQYDTDKEHKRMSPVVLNVTIHDTSQLKNIRRAIQLIKGVDRVAVL